MVRSPWVLQRSCLLAPFEEQLTLTVGILKYSRDLAFTAATAYADAAEAGHLGQPDGGQRGGRGTRRHRSRAAVPGSRAAELRAPPRRRPYW